MKNYFAIALMTRLSVAYAQVEKKPNFLVILTDDLRMNALSYYNDDCPIETPPIWC